MTGPLAHRMYAHGWRAELAARGYAPHSVTAHAQLMAHLSGWLAATGRGVDALTGEVVRQYARARRAAGYQNRTTERAVAPLLGYLRGLRAAPPLAAPVPATPAEVVVGESVTTSPANRAWQPGRGITTGVFARLFLTELGISEGGPGRLRPRWSPPSRWPRRTPQPGHMRSLVSVLRLLLRFLHLTGVWAGPLAAAVPSVPGW